MLTGSFYTGLSGLQTNATGLEVIGNNLSNINTSGFKRSQANFSQIMANSLQGISGAANPIQVGLGSRTTEVVSRFSQGSIQTTGIKTHLAIQGEGFFQLELNGNPAYTRSGNFGFDDRGNLTAGSGASVQGYQGTASDGTLDLSGGIRNIQIDFGQASAPRATELVRFITNLSAEAATGDVYPTTMEVFDSKGVAHQLGLTFTKQAAPGEWRYEFSFDDGTVSTTIPTQFDGTITFDGNGNLDTLDGLSIQDPAIANRTIGISNLNTGAADMLFTWDLVQISGDPLVPNTSVVTGYGNTSSTGTLFQDGYSSGVLQDIDFDQDGTLIGFFDNGLTLELARVAVATFNNDNGLKQIDGGLYLSTAASGPASVDGEGTGGRGSILASSLEASNVDIAEEFTSLIIHQRGYQSNSRTVTTVDQLLQEAINLKR